MNVSPSTAARHSPRLAAALAISSLLLLVELAVGTASHSLALLADAGHLFADVSGMAVSLGAIWLASRPSSGGRSYGLYRIEIVAATANALLLLGIAVVVLAEGVRRFFSPPDIAAAPVAFVAAIAILASLVSLRLLGYGQRESITMRGAYLEVLGDLLGAVAVFAGSVVILATGWRPADAIASIIIGLLMVPRTLALLRDSVDVLLEATPKGVDLAEVRSHVLEAPGVEDVPDLHAWTITSGMNVVSAHVVVRRDGDPGAVLDHLVLCLSDDFDINHSTFQLETPDHVLWEVERSQVRH